MTTKDDPLYVLPKQLDDPDFAGFRDAVLSPEASIVVQYFDGMSEKERKRHAKYCYDFCKFFEKAFVSTPFDHIYKYNADGIRKGGTIQASVKGAKLGDIWGNAKLAVIATASWSTLKELNWFYDMERVETILRARRPEWTLDFLALLIGRIDLCFHMEVYWEPYRRFVHEGIVAPKRFDAITELMFAILSGSRFAYAYVQGDGEEGSEIMAGLKNDPDLIEHELWHIFEIEAFRRNWCYTTHDRFDKWKDTFCELILEGTIPKEKVFDGCFSALSRNFSDHQSKWFVQLLERMIEKLSISEQELIGDQRFLALLDHDHSSPRGLGLKILERLLKSDSVKLDGIAARLNSTLRESAKTKPKKAIALLATMLRKRPDLRNEIFESLLTALEHEAVEIQNAALDLLLECNAFENPTIRDAVLERSSLLASSVQKRIPGGNAPKIAAKQQEDSFSEQLEMVFVREPIEPIRTFDELLDSATCLIESANDRDEIERFLDGVSRLGTEKPVGFEKMTAPLLKRMLKSLGTDQNTYTSDDTAKSLDVFPPFTGENIAADCFFIVLAWIVGEVPQHKKIPTKNKKTILSEVSILGKRWIHWSPYDNDEGCPAYWIFSGHAKALAQQVVQGVSRHRLSAPTHRGGWIDPTVFVQRLTEAYESKIVHEDIDRVLALLRLDLQGREEALKLLDAKIKKRDEYVQAVRYALGAAKCKIGKTAHYWIAAGRSRLPFEDIEALEKAFPDYGPDAGRAAVYSLKERDGYQMIVPCEPTSRKRIELALFPTVALHASNTYDYMDARQENDWKLCVWPSNPDPAIGAAIQSHFEYQNDNYDTGFIPYLEVLQKSEIAIRKISAAAIFVGLTMKYAAIPMAATDTMILAISQGRLKEQPVLEAVRELLATGLMTPSRWLKPLQIVAEQSPKHALLVMNLLEGIIPHLDLRTLGGFLELLHEIAITQERPIRSEECLKFLTSLKGSGKAAKLAKKLLEIQR